MIASLCMGDDTVLPGYTVMWVCLHIPRHIHCLVMARVHIAMYTSKQDCFLYCSAIPKSPGSSDGIYMIMSECIVGVFQYTCAS